MDTLRASPTLEVRHSVPLSSASYQPSIATAPITSFNTIDVFTRDQQIEAVKLLQKVLPTSSSNRAVFPTFRSISQKDMALACIQANLKYRDLMFIMPTGFGKLLAVLISAMYQKESRKGKLTVVIVPIIVLTKDIENRAKACGLIPHVFDGSQALPDLVGTTDLVIATHEGAHSALFETGLRTLSSRNQLGTINIDEVHTIATWGSFRQKMIKVAQLCLSMKTSVVMLTATAPPDLLNLLQLYVGSSLSTFTIKREICDRKNLRYLRHSVNIGTLSDFTVALCSMLCSSVTNLDMNGPCKVIIYCSLVVEVESLFLKVARACPLATVLKYHGRLNVQEKEAVFNQWNAIDDPPKHEFIVATSAFGMGVDGDVTLVVHMGMPRCILDFIQGSGRAGRVRGSKGISLLITSTQNVQQVNQLVETDVHALPESHRDPTPAFMLNNVAKMKQYTHGSDTCARQMISRFNGDCDIVDACVGTSEPCDYCLRAYPDIKSVDLTGNEGAVFRGIAGYLNIWPAQVSSSSSVSTSATSTAQLSTFSGMTAPNRGSNVVLVAERLSEFNTRKRNRGAVLCTQLRTDLDALLDPTTNNCFICPIFHGVSSTVSSEGCGFDGSSVTSCSTGNSVLNASGSAYKCYYCLGIGHGDSNTGCNYRLIRGKRWRYSSSLKCCIKCTAPARLEEHIFHASHGFETCSYTGVAQFVSIALSRSKDIRNLIKTEFPHFPTTVEDQIKWLSQPDDGLLRVSRVYMLIIDILREYRGIDNYKCNAPLM